MRTGPTKRKLQQCGTFRQTNTTYNDIKEIPPYAGIMFEMFSKVEMEILTLEIDVRFEDASDLYVEVYVADGGYSAIVNDESAWELVAKATMVLAPEGAGAIIPVSDFKPVLMAERSKKSFYITMKERAIDFTAYALQKTGELHIENDDFNILVGSGLAEYKFPEKIDRILDPQFSGVIHYRIPAASCEEEPLTSTEVDLKMLFGAEASPEFTQSINTIADTVVDQVLLQHETLIKYKEMFSLAVKEKAQAELIPFTGKCPDTWSVCPASYLKIVIKLSHKATLPGGSVKLEFLSDYASIVGAIQTSLPDNIQSIYLGERSVSFKYNMTLDGVTASMDSIQEKYFVDVGKTFIDLAANPRFSSVLDIAVDSEKGPTAATALRQRRTQEQPNRIGGIIHGALPAAFESTHFRETLDIAFTDSNSLIDMLKIGGLRPSQISEDNRIAYFMDISEISIEYEEIVRAVAPAAAAGDSSSLSNANIAMIEGAAFIVFLIGITWAVHSYSTKQRKKREASEKRKRLREEARNEREKEEKKAKDEATAASMVSATEAPKLGKDGTKKTKKTEKQQIAQVPASGIGKKGPQGKKARPAISAKLTSDLKQKPDNGKVRPGPVKSASVADLASKNVTDRADVKGKADEVKSKTSVDKTKAAATPNARPGLARSQSTSVLGASGSTATKKPVPLPGASKTPSLESNCKPIKPADKALAGATQHARPGIVRSQSSSVLMSTKNTTLKAMPGLKAPIPPSAKSDKSAVVKAGQPASANKPQRPNLTKSLSSSVLQSGLVVPGKVNGASGGAETTKAAVLNGGASVARPNIVRSQSNTLLSTAAKPLVVGGTNGQAGGPGGGIKPVAAKPAPARPALVKSMSSSVLVKASKGLQSESALKGPKLLNTLKPKALEPVLPTLGALPNVSKVSEIEAVKSIPETTLAAPKATAAPANPVRPGFARSQSSSVLLAKPVVPATATKAGLTGPVVNQDPPSQTGVNGNPTNAACAISRPSVVTKVHGSTSVAQPKPRLGLARSQSSSQLQLSAPKAPAKPALRPELQKEEKKNGVSDAAKDDNGTVPPLAAAMRPGFQRSQSISVLNAQAGISKPQGAGTKGPAGEAEALPSTLPKAPTSADPNVSAAPAKAVRPGFQRSQSISVLNAQAGISKPQGAGTKGPAGEAEVLPSTLPKAPTSAVPNVSAAPAKAVRPGFARSQSTSILVAKSVQPSIAGQAVLAKKLGEVSIAGLGDKAAPVAGPGQSRPTVVLEEPPVSQTVDNGQISSDSKVASTGTASHPKPRPALARSLSTSVLQLNAPKPAVAKPGTSKPSSAVMKVLASAGGPLPNNGLSSSPKVSAPNVLATLAAKPLVIEGTNGQAGGSGGGIKPVAAKSAPVRPALVKSMSSSVLMKASKGLQSESSLKGPKLLNTVKPKALEPVLPTLGALPNASKVSESEAVKSSTETTLAAPKATAAPANPVRPGFARSLSSSILLAQPAKAGLPKATDEGPKTAEISGVPKVATAAKPGPSRPPTVLSKGENGQPANTKANLNQPSTITKIATKIQPKPRPTLLRSQSSSVL